MSRVDKVTAEPRMDDLLASIRRAIHDQGAEVAETKPDIAIDDMVGSGDSPPANFLRPINNRCATEQPSHGRSVDSQDIVTLRNKISRELNQGEQLPMVKAEAPVNPVPSPQAPAAQQPVSRFKNLLGGAQRQEPVQSSNNTAPQRLRPSINDSAEAPPESVKSHAQGRPAVLPTAPRRPVQSYPVRSAFDAPGRNGNGSRPPFGQSSVGIKSIQPPARPSAEGMISPETSSIAANSFSRLAEQMFGREGGERSIDDLARELLHPMLKQWLDQNLARIVEQLVHAEIERVARRGGR
jgi:cell pole-organizing protein PopZ